MRGELRIKSARSPYRRAGLAWPTREPVIAPIVELDGERFLRLARDPVLRIEIDDGNGFKALPIIPDDADVETAQMMIDSLRAELPPAEEDPSLHLDPASLVARVDELTAELANARAQFDDFVQRSASDLDALRQERDDARQRTAEVENASAEQAAEIAKLTEQLAAAQKPTPRTKAGKSDSQPA